MPDTSFQCPNCGAQLQWSPGQSSLTCPYCGHVIHEPPAAGSEIREYRLDDEAIRRAARGWGTEKRTLACSACGAVSEVDPELEVTTCPFCGSTQVVEQELEDVIRPESLIPFRVEQDEAVRKFREWLKGLWFRPGALKSQAQLERIVGVYVPVWTFDCETESTWSADAGYRYTVTETVTEEEDGQTVEKTVEVEKIRWQPASGTHHGSFDDWLVEASKGLEQSEFKELLPYDTKLLVPYETRYLAGFQAERYDLDLEGAWKVAQEEIREAVREACEELVPGDTHRNLRVNTTFRDVRFKHALLPVWIAAYRYQGKPYRYLVNGVTGKATGTAPIAWGKVVALVAAVLVVLVALFLLLGH